jgi:uncharacterized protein (TIGR03118 family)
LRLSGLVAVSAVAAGFYACGDDATNNPDSSAGTDGSMDSSVPKQETGMVMTDTGARSDTAANDTGANETAANDTGADAGETSVSLIQQKVTVTKLVADQSDAGAVLTDPNLVNAWGLAFNPSGPAWVSDNHTGVATVYETSKLDAGALLTVTVPTPDGGGTAAPTGQVFNSTTSFMGDKFIVATEDGTISGWQPTDAGALPASYTLRADSTASGAVYKGLGLVPAATPFLLAADFHNGKLDVFDSHYAPILPDAGGKWTDANVGTGYAPFNIMATSTNVFVTYAKQTPGSNDETHGAGFGAISVFDFTGTVVKTLVVTGKELNAPWGMTLVPASGWGSIPAGTLLVGNFGDGAIHAYDPTSGALLGTLYNGSVPLVLDGLWGIEFGPADVADAGTGTNPQQLYFASGPGDEANGLYGYLTIAP